MKEQMKVMKEWIKRDIWVLGGRGEGLWERKWEGSEPKFLSFYRYAEISPVV